MNITNNIKNILIIVLLLILGACGLLLLAAGYPRFNVNLPLRVLILFTGYVSFFGSFALLSKLPAMNRPQVQRMRAGSVLNKSIFVRLRAYGLSTGSSCLAGKLRMVPTFGPVLPSVMEVTKLKEMLKDYVLSAVANDYEDFAMVSREVSQWLHDRGMSVTRHELEQAIEELISEGLAQAYELSPNSRSAMPVAYSPESIEQLWFYVTPRGKDIVKQRYE